MSDDVIIPPANAGSTGFISRNGHHDGHHGHHDHFDHHGAHMDDQFARAQKQASDAATDTVAGFKDAQATAYQIEGRSALEAAKNYYQLSTQSERTFNALTVQATMNAAAAELRAAQNAAAAAAQLAACCCELKELTRAENSQTRDLINANTVQGLRDALAAAQRFIPLTVAVPL